MKSGIWHMFCISKTRADRGKLVPFLESADQIYPEMGLTFEAPKRVLPSEINSSTIIVTCLLRLVGRIVVIKFGVLLDAFVIVHPPIVRRRDVAVSAVRCSPVEHVFQFNGMCVERTFEVVQNPHLKRE